MATEKFVRQPGEAEDFDFDFTDWLASKTGRLASSHTITSDDGIVVTHSRVGAVVNVVTSGGVSGSKYLVTCKLTTDGVPALTKELEAYVVVKETP